MTDAELLMAEIEDKEHLQLWLEKFLGFTLPDHSVTDYADSSPLSFTYEVYRAIMDGKSLNIIGLSGRDTAKCQVKGTSILTRRGLVFIEDVKVGDFVFDGFDYKEVLNTFDEGVKPGIKISLNSGNSSHGTPHHRVLVPTATGVDWRRLDELKVGDRVLYSTPQLNFDFERNDFDLGYFLGLLTGDGGLSLMDDYRLIRFSGIDPEVLDQFMLLANRYLPGTQFKFDGRCTYSLSSVNAVKVLKDLGMKSVKSTEKRMPDSIKGNESAILGFVAGMYDSDGSVGKGREIYICQSNRELLSDIQICLATLGVHSKINKTPVKEEFLAKYQQPYKLVITGNGVDRLRDIGFESHVSQGPRAFWKDNFALKPTQAMPIPSDLLQNWTSQFAGVRPPKVSSKNQYIRTSFVKKSHLSKYESISKEKIISQRNAITTMQSEAKALKEKFSPSEMPRWIATVEAVKHPKWIERLEDFWIDTVKSVESLDGYFYDLEVEESHSYWANGIINHNTVSLSIIDLLALLHDQRDAIHCAMITKQAQRAREYLETYITKNPLMKASVTKQNTKEIRMIVNGEEVGLELISLDPKQVQGAHKGLVSYDELASSVDPLKIKAYRDSSGIPGSTKKGKPAVVVKITSRQAGNTIPEVEIKNAHKNNLQIRRWTTIDCMKACPPERAGTIPSPMNIHIIKGLAYNDEDFGKLQEIDREDFKRVTDTMEGCLSCPLLMYCQGKARHQKSTSALLREIDDVIHKVHNSGSHEWVLAQLMSLQPSIEGLVYPEFSSDIHIPSWEDLWEHLTGVLPAEIITRPKFIAELKRRGATFIAGVDWGYTHPATCVVVAVDNQGKAFVVEATGMVRKNDPQWVEIIKKHIHPKYDVQMYLPDTENPSGISLLKAEGLPVAQIDKGPGSVKAGINAVKGLLRVAGTNNLSRLFLCPDLPPTSTDVPGLIEEFSLYSKEVDASGAILDDKIRKQNDHYMDALRYCLYWYFAKATGKATFAGGSSSSYISPTQGTPVNELLRTQGINVIDNREEFDEFGNPIADSNGDDPNKPGGGSFQWRFT